MLIRKISLDLYKEKWLRSPTRTKWVWLDLNFAVIKVAETKKRSSASDHRFREEVSADWSDCFQAKRGSQ